MTNNDWGRDYPDPNYGRDFGGTNFGRDYGGLNYGRTFGGTNFGMAAGVNAPVVSPASASVNRGTSQQFSANVPVTWSVLGSGSITSGGLYSLPVAGGAGVAVVRAAAVADPTKYTDVPITIALSPLLTSLVSHWSLEEASGTRADDYGGNSLTDNNTVTQATGKVGQAAQFVAANSESLSITSNASLQTGDIDFSGCAWIQVNATGTKKFIGKWGAGGSEWLLWMNSTQFRFEINASGGVTVTGAASPTTWYFLVWWHDSVANTINIQRDNGTVFSTAWTTGAGASLSAILEFGGNGGGLAYHDGLIDQVGFWKRVLTATERTWLFNSGSGRSWTDILAYRG